MESVIDARMAGLLCYCRPGFEPELAAELSERAAHAGHPGYARTERNSAFVTFICDEAAALSRALPWRELIYARQKLQLVAELRDLDPKDRITPMLAALVGQSKFGDLWVEHPDSDTAKPLAGLARSFGNALRPALKRAGLWAPNAERRLHVVLLSGTHLILGTTRPAFAAPWPQGIPRLRMLADAPSRSALKLEEAFMSLLSPQEKALPPRPA